MRAHRHSYGPWKMFRPKDTAHLDEKAYLSGLTFPPFWMQSCECGFENWLRTDSKPRASFRFSQHWRVKRL
jgi:hypothetical protein